MILIAYDGSPDAQAAIDTAALLMPGASATVLTVWEPLLEVLARSGGLGQTAVPSDVEQIDAANAAHAEIVAAEGAARATAAGLPAGARATARRHTIADSVLDQSDELDAQAIVIGTRGLTGVRSLLGSVSHAVVQHAHRAVIVVPAAQTAQARTAARSAGR